MKSVRALCPSPTEFDTWITSLGYADEERFLQAVTGSSLYGVGDLWDLYFSQRGYTGSFADNVKVWMECLTNQESTTDGTNIFFENFKYLTFMKNFSVAARNNSVAADFSIGSYTGTFTRTTGDVATYIDSNGVVRLATATLPRFPGGLYDATGFHAQSGLMIEAAGTNLLQDSYFSNGTTTYWIANGTATVTNDATYANKYLGGKTQKVVSAAQYDGVKTAAAKRPTLVNAKKITVGALVQGTGTAMVYLEVNGGAAQYGTATNLTGNATPIYIQYTFTADASDVAYVGVVSNDDASTFWVNTIQCESGAAGITDSPYSLSFIPTTTSAATRNAESLYYAILNNRNAASESVFIKFAPESAFANDGVQRNLATTATKSRIIRKDVTNTTITFYPNGTDSSGAYRFTTTSIQANTSYVYGAISIAPTGDPNSRNFLNGSQESIDGTVDWTEPAWGDNFYLGSTAAGATQLNGIIQGVAIFSDAKDSTSALNISNILSS